MPSNSTFLAENWVHDHEFAKHDGKADGNTTESTITSPWLAAFAVNNIELAIRFVDTL